MRKLVLAAVLVLMAGGAQAATLNVVGGQLHGAAGVLVDGSLYDVEFLDGYCPYLFNGCDDVSDFTFQTEASALLASQALLDQVFLDGAEGAFDSQPSLTNGCGAWNPCNKLTPYHPIGSLGAPPSVFWVMAVRNSSDPASDGIYGPTAMIDFEQLATFDALFAVWSPIPEPSTALLVGIGLVGLASRRRV